MSKINLTSEAERLFGRFLPTVNIKQVMVESYDESETAVPEGNLTIRVVSNMSFTKPPEFTRQHTAHMTEILRNKGLRQNFILSPHEDLNI